MDKGACGVLKYSSALPLCFHYIRFLTPSVLFHVGPFVIAGARFYSESKSKDQIKEKNGQWSLTHLGGKPFRSDGIKLVLYPLQVAKTAAAAGTDVPKDNMIELTIRKTKPRTTANIRRTPFEEDNYLASAWSRPRQLPLVRGPRCLRVLGPMSNMQIANLTHPLTSGRVLEGTVNRVLLRLTAGAQEICTNIKCTISCSSVLLRSDGTTENLTTEEVKKMQENGKDGAKDSAGEEEAEKEKEEKTKEEEKTDEPDLSNVRLPIIVSPASVSSVASTATAFGYDLPKGWAVAGTKRGVVVERDVATGSEPLKPGEVTYLFIDLYRPPPSLPEQIAANDAKVEKLKKGEIADEEDVFQTDFDVKLTYTQSKPRANQSRGGRRRRPPPPGASSSSSSSADGEQEVVSLEYSSSVFWDSPITTEFLPISKSRKAPPGGSRHPSNAVLKDEEGKKGQPDSPENGDTDPGDDEVLLVDGEKLNLRCLLKANDASSDIKVAVERIRFKDLAGEQACSIVPVGTESDGLILETVKKDPSRVLAEGTKFGVDYSVVATMNEGYKRGSATKPLGVLCVDWQSVAFDAPDDAATVLPSGHRQHGPLVLLDTPTATFLGPTCYVESSPFLASVSTVPSRPSARAAFQIRIDIANKTAVHQSLTLHVTDRNTSKKGSTGAPADSVFVSGFVGGQLKLSPREKKTVVLTAMALKAGKVVLPCVTVSSQRYKSWVINEMQEDRALFIEP